MHPYVVQILGGLLLLLFLAAVTPLGDSLWEQFGDRTKAEAVAQCPAGGDVQGVIVALSIVGGSASDWEFYRDDGHARRWLYGYKSAASVIGYTVPAGWSVDDPSGARLPPGTRSSASMLTVNCYYR
jgi:hypothetical protein